MATKMSYGNPYQSKGASAPNGPIGGEVTPELHIKMSKKIAQLTKVIYSLNTKNDEHESAFQNLKESHEEEMQKLIADTKNKMAQYQSKVGKEMELRQRLQSLEATLAGNESHRHEAMEEFNLFKRKAVERESQIKAEHSQRVLSLSQDLLSIKRDFEDRFRQFEDVKQRLESERNNQIAELRTNHAAELSELQQKLKSSQSEVSQEKEQLILQYNAEINKLHEQCEALTVEKKHLCDDYESKLSKAQAFYERELAVLKEQTQSSAANEWKEQEALLRKQFNEKEHALQKKIGDLNAQLSVVEEDLAEYKNKLQAAESTLANKDANTIGLGKQLLEARQEISTATTKLKQVEGELAASRERCDEQAADMIKKSSLLGTLEATRLSNEATIKDLQGTLAKMEDKVNWLESERRNLEDSKHSLTEEQTSQLRSLEKALEELSIEKQTMKERYDQALENAKTTSETNIEQLKKEHTSQIGDLQSKHKEETEAAAKMAAEELEKLQKEMQKKLEDTDNRLSKERDAAKSLLEQTEADLSAKLKAAADECERMQRILEQSKQGLGSASSHIENLSQTNNRLKTELESTQKELRESKGKSLSVSNELDKLKHLHESKMLEMREELKNQLNQLSQDLDGKWTDTLRKECETLRSELTQQHSEDKRAALKQLSLMKEQELEAARTGWEIKIQELHQQLSSIKDNLATKSERAMNEMVELQRRADQDLNKLKFEMTAAAEAHAKKIAELEAELNKAKLQSKDQQSQALMDLEDRLSSQHLQNMAAQIESHKKAIESLETSAKQDKMTALTEMTRKTTQNLEKLKLELSQRHMAEMDQLSRAHKTQMAAAKMELERAVELKNQKEREHQNRIEDFQDDLNHRDRHIQTLDEQIADMKSKVSALRKDLEFKGHEMQRIKSDANDQLRNQKENLLQRHEEEIDDFTAVKIREHQAMLEEFNAAQELLKDKISALQIMLEEAEERYHNRDSRPEDIEQLARLRDMVEEREEYMKRLVEEKRYFQMELVNRETNFNKVFNSNPNVGVLNPFVKKKKKGEREAMRYVSAPSLNTTGNSPAGSSPNNPRLDPIPNSPTHDMMLNPKRPLHGEGLKRPRPPQPPRTKKFINT
ncbi:protein FAM184A-like [Amphiura filiformis]|uniref:protein FAM184A-like n=1 Tax=Amphiura filiformis TaxID=82378 RepID=UPI003B223B77